MSLDDYLRQFGDNHRVTLVGPLLAEPPNLSAPEEPLIWVDGGADYRRPGGTQGSIGHGNIGHGNIEHDSIGFAVGDGDSSRSELHQYLPVDKDYSDLSYVLGRLPNHFTEVILLGFLGARRDHELFNLGEVHHFLCAAKRPTQVLFERSITAYSTGEWAFEAHSIFSLAVLEPTTVTLAGACKFRLTAPTKIAPLTSLGLSNHGFGVITLVTLGPAFIFTPECDNDRHDNDGGRRQTPPAPAQSTT